MTTKPKDGIDDINGIDLLADAAECVNTNVTGAITSAIEEFVSLEAEGEALSESAARVSKRVNELKLNVFSELLDAYGATSFTDAKTGKVIDLELLVSAKLPKDDAKREACLRYIEEVGGGDLVKTSVTVEFDKGEIEQAKALVALLEDAEYRPTLARSIHSSTLAAFVRERVRDGKPIDYDQSGVYVAKIAVPKEPKVSKTKIRGRK